MNVVKVQQETIKNGEIKNIRGQQRVHYDGHWILFYPTPEETLANHKQMIDHLTRRAFHHTETGINTPGSCLDKARIAYEKETNPRRKRVNAAMLAGALFNRATDIFTTIVELGEKNVHISRQNELMQMCGSYFREALELGRQVKHYSGEEGIDELWGEPFKAFTMTLDYFYEQRYIKIALTMREIDEVSECIINTYRKITGFEGIEVLINEFAKASKEICETAKSDDAFFNIWPRYVATAEEIEIYKPRLGLSPKDTDRERGGYGMRLLVNGRNLIRYTSSARVPMPKSRTEYLNQLAKFERKYT